MNTRVNVNIPQALFVKSQELVEKGFFSNFSELVRDGIRMKIKEYENNTDLSEDEKKLFVMLKKANEKGLLLSEKEMKKHGLEV
ncbi:MAG: ribbon-helix-helix domain-containing protein [Nanoarchaeota archaeon]|nr:ribbon-helix-helix domain-containing protein [Nanoarchaeota archaeon]